MQGELTTDSRGGADAGAVISRTFYNKSFQHARGLVLQVQDVSDAVTLMVDGCALAAVGQEDIAQVCMLASACVHVCVCACACMYVRACVCMHVCMHVCMLVYPPDFFVSVSFENVTRADSLLFLMDHCPSTTTTTTVFPCRTGLRWLWSAGAGVRAAAAHQCRTPADGSGV